MPASNDVVVFGVASGSAVEQWDGHPTPTGIMLRWFPRQDLGYPDLGWDVHRASVPDIPPLPFNDLNVPLVEGHVSWTPADRITLACADGLHFVRTAQAGWWQLVLPPATPITVRFNSAAWLVVVQAGAGRSALRVQGLVAGDTVLEETLAYPGQRFEWRTRGIESLTLDGTGSVSFIGFHLLDDPLAWQRLAHRCLPVIDAAASPSPVTMADLDWLVAVAADGSIPKVRRSPTRSAIVASRRTPALLRRRQVASSAKTCSTRVPRSSSLRNVCNSRSASARSIPTATAVRGSARAGGAGGSAAWTSSVE
jgi:hypothetical protein